MVCCAVDNLDLLELCLSVKEVCCQGYRGRMDGSQIRIVRVECVYHVDLFVLKSSEFEPRNLRQLFTGDYSLLFPTQVLMAQLATLKRLLEHLGVDVEASLARLGKANTVAAHREMVDMADNLSPELAYLEPTNASLG